VIFKTAGVCSRNIRFDVAPDGIVSGVSFEGGCNGNGQGISRLVEGCHIDDVIARLEGIRCEGKRTSCPDQLAGALREHQEKKKREAA